MNEEWFKVELLQDYGGEDDTPSLQAWLKGDKEKSLELLDKWAADPNDPWVEDIQKKSDVRKTRIHVVEYPYTPYLEWEVEVYKRRNIPVAKENIYLVAKDKVKYLKLPNGDFCIFDRKRVARNYYDPKGKAYQVDYYEESDDISQFLKFREELLKLAKPVKSY